MTTTNDAGALRELTMRREYAVAPERLWAAWTTRDGLLPWWWNHWSGVSVQVDPRVGGSYRIVASAQGIEVAGRYLEVLPPRRLVFTWEWTDAEGSQTGETVAVDFEAQDRGTLLTLRHTGPWPDEAPAAAYAQGWGFVLDALSTLLTAG